MFGLPSVAQATESKHTAHIQPRRALTQSIWNECCTHRAVMREINPRYRTCQARGKCGKVETITSNLKLEACWHHRLAFEIIDTSCEGVNLSKALLYSKMLQTMS